MKHARQTHNSKRAHAALDALGRLDAALALAERDFAESLCGLPEATRAAGRNLVHYVALRQPCHESVRVSRD